MQQNITKIISYQERERERERESKKIVSGSLMIFLERRGICFVFLPK